MLLTFLYILNKDFTIVTFLLCQSKQEITYIHTDHQYQFTSHINTRTTNQTQYPYNNKEQIQKHAQADPYNSEGVLDIQS